MIKKSILYGIVLSSCLGTQACKQAPTLSNLEVIQVFKPTQENTASADEFFSSVKYVPLETTEQSLIRHIDRIYVHHNRFFISDKTINAVLIFNEDGKFLNKIQPIGNGSGEYTGLADFTIDEEGKRIILFSHRPYKLLYFDLDGRYQREKIDSNLYRNIAYQNGRIHYLTTHNVAGPLFFSKTEEAEDKLFSLEPPQYAKLFESNGMGQGPSLIKSGHLYVNLFHCDTIFRIENGKAVPQYQIDFVDNKMPSELFNGQTEAGDIISEAFKSAYGFGLRHFRENKDFISFSYTGGRVVIYSKKTKQAKTFKRDEMNENSINSNPLEQDGSNNALIAKVSYNDINFLVNYLKKEGKWDNLPETSNIKVLEKVVDENSNPVLQIYIFKE